MDLKSSAWFSRVVVVANTALLAIFIAGCAGRDAKQRGISEEVIAPKTPSFLIGPASALLTNAEGFSAQLTLDLPTDTNRNHALSGVLLGQGSRLVFAPTGRDRTFIWDVHEHRGYVLSEALQGYAPLASPVQVTKLTTMAEAAGPSSDRVNGHRGHEAEVTIATDDGSTANFSIWRAADLNGFPVRIKALTAVKPFIVNLADVRPAALAPNLFLPPDGFTKYATPEAMASELLARKSAPKKTHATTLDEDLPQKPHVRY